MHKSQEEKEYKKLQQYQILQKYIENAQRRSMHIVNDLQMNEINGVYQIKSRHTHTKKEKHNEGESPILTVQNFRHTYKEGGWKLFPTEKIQPI